MYFYYIMSYSNGLLPSTTSSTNEPQRGLPGIGFKLTDDGNFDLDNKQMKNLSGGTDKSDAVNYGQLLQHSENYQNNYHLQQSFTFYKNFGNGLIVPQSNTIQIDPNLNHHGLHYILKEGSDSGFGGQAWVSLKMTNSLPAGVYTVVFETFAGIYNIFTSSVTKLNDETLLQQVQKDDNYTITIFSHDYQTTHSKAYIQFTSNGQPGEITFQIRYYGSSYTNLALYFFFFSRVITGKHNTAFDHALFDVDDVQLTNQILYFEDVNLNGNKIKNIAHPTEDEDGANKKYVDDEIAKLPHSDNGTLKLDGSRAMTGTLNLGGQRVINIKEFVEDDSSQAASDAQKYDVVNWGKIHEIRGDLKREINQVEYEALNRINPDPMQDNINMGNHFITNIKDPLSSNSHYTATVNFVNKTVSDNNVAISTLIDSKITEVDYLNIKAAKQENVFSFVTDDDLFKEDDSDITKIGKVDKDFYDIRKETYQFDINYDSNIGYYSTRTGIDLKAIDLGEYTLVFEMYFNETKLDKNEVIVNAVSTPLNISRNRTNKFADHSRTVINFHKYGNIGIIDLDIDITMKNKGGISYDPTTTIYVIVYGVSGHQNDVDSRVWDRVYYIENNAVKFEATIDMDNHNIGMKNGQIKGLGDGVENTDAVNIKQINEMESNIAKYIKTEINKVKTEIDKVKTDDTNNSNILTALYNYIIKNELKEQIIKDMYFSDSGELRTANTFLFKFDTYLDLNNRNNLTFYYVFKHNASTNNVMTIELLWSKYTPGIDGVSAYIYLYIHVSKSQIKISINPLINEPYLSLINIPNKAVGK